MLEADMDHRHLPAPVARLLDIGEQDESQPAVDDAGVIGDADDAEFLSKELQLVVELLAERG